MDIKALIKLEQKLVRMGILLRDYNRQPFTRYPSHVAK